MTKTSIAIIVVVVLSLLAAAFFWLNRPRRIVVDAPLPANFPEQGFSHDNFEELLQSFVTGNGRVDYERWQQSPASVQQLDGYLTAVSRFSPANAPLRFASRNDELAYWIYGYNAYVIKSVLDNWPLESVTDVKAPLEVVTGLGFFHQLRFSFGGEYLSLLSVENERIRKKYKDPRIHFVLNCASESCPVARPGLPVGGDLEQSLTDAAVDFINDSDNVQVDHEKRVVYLSRIFKWYEKDFYNAVQIDGDLSGNLLLSYVAQYAFNEVSEDLALASNYEVVFRDYDWGVNSTH